MPRSESDCLPEFNIACLIFTLRTSLSWFEEKFSFFENLICGLEHNLNTSPHIVSNHLEVSDLCHSITTGYCTSDPNCWGFTAGARILLEGRALVLLLAAHRPQASLQSTDETFNRFRLIVYRHKRCLVDTTSCNCALVNSHQKFCTPIHGNIRYS